MSIHNKLQEISKRFFAREERIQWNYSCATIRISHKQFLAKYFAVVESGLNEKCFSRNICMAVVELGLNDAHYLALMKIRVYGLKAL